jgi:hypothetical protein
MMREVSDIIQDLALAYGERNTIEACLVFLGKLKNAENVKVMTTAFRVFAIDVVKRDLGFYLVHGAVSRAASKHLIATQNVLIKELASNVDNILACLNVPLEQLHCPVATNFEKYYSEPNFGEVTNARL